MYQSVLRPFLGILLIGIFQSATAQQLLFDRSMAEKDVPRNALLPSDLRSHYAATRYVQQADFLQGKDFLIVVTPGVLVKSRFLKMMHYPTGSYSYVGLLEGGMAGEISFSKFQDRTAGMIVLHDGRKFMIDQTSDNYFAISQTRDDIFTEREKRPDFLEPHLNPEFMGQASPLAALSICDQAAACTGASVIDLMIVYTPQAETAWGGASSTVAALTQAVTNMNTAMTNSGVTNVSYRLVHTQKVNYTESGDFGTDLNRLTSSADGYIDEVHTLRNTYGADLVSLIIGSPNSSCGIGWLNTGTTAYNASNGFNVSLYSCVVSNFTMSHEFGHNMGLRHDWYVDGSTSPCAHHHGFTNRTAILQGTNSASSARWRTIMAYNNECSAAGISCTRINRWSNPGLTYNGDPTGIAIGNTNPSDEAYAFYRMACLVAAFRPEASSCSAPGGVTTSSISKTEATLSWSAVSGASGYDVDYTTNTSGSWTAAAAGTTSTTNNITGLTANTVYYWRVRANCTAASSAYTQSSFTTFAACPTPSGLSTSSLTTSSAILSWGAVSGAINYTVDYKLSTASSWTNVATATTATSVNLTGLAAATTYNWRVVATCAEGTGASAQANFTTNAPAVCTDSYESNNTSNTSKTISLGANINAAISTALDVDWFRFTTPNSTATNLRITLSNLPMNYNVELYNKSLALIGSGTSTGTTTEIIKYASLAKKATYYVKVFGATGTDFTTASCYQVRAESASTPFDTEAGTGDQATMLAALQTEPLLNLKLFPVPAKDVLQLLITSDSNIPAVVKIHDLTGRVLVSKNMELRNGMNQYRLSLEDYPTGLYIIKLVSGKHTLTEKVMIQK